MNRQMTKRAARQFVKGWKAVREAEREELRSTPAAEKFQQLQALVRSAVAFDWDGEDEKGTEGVRLRWRRLREAFRA